jgi:CopG family nickel-responsive transcriptional regulator
MANIVRVSVTFPPELLREFDEVTRKVGYANRSKAVQDSVRSFIVEHKWLREKEGKKTGVLVMVYDHEFKGLDEALTDIQHKYSRIVRSSMHVHLSDRDCLEAVAVEGDAEEIKRLHQELMTKRGVKQAKLTIVSS